MGDQIPWHHLQGLHVVLITIIPLPQTPQPFQFLSAQNPEYVTLFSFCKKLFCMKNSQQIKAISLKKRAYEWRLREFWAGPQYRRWEQLCHPSCWLMAQVQLALHCAANRAGMVLTLFPKKLYGSDYEPRIQAQDELFIAVGRLPSTATESGNKPAEREVKNLLQLHQPRKYSTSNALSLLTQCQQRQVFMPFLCVCEANWDKVFERKPAHRAVHGPQPMIINVLAELRCLSLQRMEPGFVPKRHTWPRIQIYIYFGNLISVFLCVEFYCHLLRYG